MKNSEEDFKCLMCYNCTSIVADYHVKKPFTNYNHYLCHYCEWEIKEMIHQDGECKMFTNNSKIITLKKSNIKDIIEYEQWLDSCTQKNT